MKNRTVVNSYQCLGQIGCLHLPGGVTEDGAAGSSKTLVTCNQTTRRHIPVKLYNFVAASGFTFIAFLLFFFIQQESFKRHKFVLETNLHGLLSSSSPIRITIRPQERRTYQGKRYGSWRCSSQHGRLIDYRQPMHWKRTASGLYARRSRLKS